MKRKTVTTAKPKLKTSTKPKTTSLGKIGKDKYTKGWHDGYKAYEIEHGIDKANERSRWAAMKTEFEGGKVNPKEIWMPSMPEILSSDRDDRRAAWHLDKFASTDDTHTSQLWEFLGWLVLSAGVVTSGMCVYYYFH